MGVKSDNSKIIDINLCPECNGIIIDIQEKAEQVCSKCGLVINERMIDTEHLETRAFNNEERKNKIRTGPPISPIFSQLDLPTKISRELTESPDFKRQIRQNNRKKWDVRNQNRAFSELKRICINKGIKERIYNSTARLYLEAYKRKITRGRSIDGVVSACLFYCCMAEGFPITMKEIAEETNPIKNGKSSNFRHIKRCYMAITKELELSSCKKDPIYYIPKFVSQLKRGSQVERIAIKLLQKVPSSIMTGKNPIGYAIAAIYLSCRINNVKITQAELEKVSGLTDATLRARVKELQKYL